MPVMRLRARRLPHRGQLLHDAALDLEPVGIVVLDEAVRGVQDGLVRPEVLGEDDLPSVAVMLEEPEHVGDRRTAPLVDALVVVGHDRDVPVPRRQ